MHVAINGTDITKLIASGGLKWSRNDLDAPNSGRALDGTMIRGRVSTKIRLDITCRPLTSDELHMLLNLILPEWVTVTYDDPMYGTVSMTMYSNNNPAEFYMIQPVTGEEWWQNITFPLIER